MPVRHNILTNQAARDNYVRGVQLLKHDFTGPTTRDFGIAGKQRPISTYDLFIVWHHFAMSTLTPPSQQDRNAGHDTTLNRRARCLRFT